MHSCGVSVGAYEEGEAPHFKRGGKIPADDINANIILIRTFIFSVLLFLSVL